MFRPPAFSHSPRTAKTIGDLPEELLLNIGAQFTELSRNRDLASLALVSKRWRPVAQEWLLKEPRFNLAFIDRYMSELGYRSHLLGQVKSLEIWSKSEGRTTRTQHTTRTGVQVYLTQPKYNALPAPDYIRQDAEFLEACGVMINHFATNKRHAKDWLEAIKDDIVPALFGVLICALPNLRELKLGDTWLMDFPLFASARSASARASYTLPYEWKHKFLLGALTAKLPHLTVLEIPSDMTAIRYSHSVTTVFDLRRFESLREVGLTMKAIQGHGIIRQGLPITDPAEIFPKTLEVLRISEATHITANFLNTLCLAKKKLHLPNLTRIEAYHMEHLDNTRFSAELDNCLDPIDDVRKICRDAEIAVYLYFPPWTMSTWESEGGTPWRLKAEPDVLHRAEYVCWRKAMGPFGVHQDPMDRVEVEWDADGDAVMI
ncbi:hypothetical protein J4E89_004712 [Alternaria sp. Ai002NY15]|nr:hypothetical protein J4E89_004712 [Alternaria sp. Ai002NY15]